MKQYFWFKFPMRFFETPEAIASLKTERGKKRFLFYIFLLCHSAKNRGYLSLDNGSPMPLSTVSLLFCESQATVCRYLSELEKENLVKKTEKGYYLPYALSLAGSDKNASPPDFDERRKEEEEKEIEIDKYLEKKKEKDKEKAKAKEKPSKPRYGNFDPEEAFATAIARFKAEAEGTRGDTT